MLYEVITLCSQQSARCIGTYVYASAGPGESTTDTVYGGHALIYENGRLLEEGDRFRFESSWICHDTDLEFLEQQRISSTSFSQTMAYESFHARTVRYSGSKPAGSELKRSVDPRPFVPSSEDDIV